MSLFVISALLHAIVGARLVPALGAWPVAGAALAALLVASAVLMPLGLRARRGPALLAWAGLIAMGAFSTLFVLTLLRDLARAAAWAFDVSGPAFAAASALAVPLLAAAITALGFANARRTAKVVATDIPVAGLPVALHGFTIAQISDVHVGPTIRREYVERIVDAVNGLRADMVAVTGDLVDGSVAELADHVAPLANLASRHGTYFVTGNHEYYSGAHAWIDALRRLKMRVLINEHVVIEHGDASVLVAGVTDPSAHRFDPAHRSDPAAALAGAPVDAGVKVLLAHQPRSAAAAAQAGYQLQLSGHTHGGQFFPWNLLVKAIEPLAAGLNRLQGLWVYTSRGTGYWGPPVRFLAPSEIAVLRLVPA